MALVIRGNSLYTIVDGPSWTQAEANSVKPSRKKAEFTSSIAKNSNTPYSFMNTLLEG